MNYLKLTRLASTSKSPLMKLLKTLHHYYLEKEKEKLAGELKRSEGMLSNERFLSKAPAEKVAEEKEKLAKYQQMMQQVEERLAQLKK